MPRQTTQQITPRATPQSQSTTPIQARAAAAPTDNAPQYLPQTKDANLQGFLEGLQAFSPAVSKWTEQAIDDTKGAAVTDRMAGKEAQQSNWLYQEHYLHTDGLVKGEQDATKLVTAFNTEFDKDGGDLEGFIKEKYQGFVGGTPPGPYLDGYNKPMVKALETVRQAHTDYQRKAVEAKVETNAMQMLDNGLRAYTLQGSQVPDGYISNIRDYMGKNLGVSGQRFDQLLFESVKTLGNEGHFDAYEVLKKPHPDGSPGLYDNPEYRAKIEDAQVHSHNVFETRSRQDRAQRYNQTMYDVFTPDDPKEAAARFREAKQSGLFKGDAEGLIKWEKLLLEKVDGKPDITQLENEGPLMMRAIKGKLSQEDVLRAESAGQITSSQRRELFKTIRQTEVENRTLAANEGKAGEAIYRTREFDSVNDYLSGVLKVRPRDPIMSNGQADIEFDTHQLAAARRELFTASRGKKPEELQAIADDITTRYIKRRQEAEKGGMTDSQKEAVIAGQVPYKSIPELIEAARAGLISTDEYKRYSDHLKRNYQK